MIINDGGSAPCVGREVDERNVVLWLVESCDDVMPAVNGCCVVGHHFERVHLKESCFWREDKILYLRTEEAHFNKFQCSSAHVSGRCCRCSKHCTRRRSLTSRGNFRFRCSCTACWSLHTVHFNAVLYSVVALSETRFDGISHSEVESRTWRKTSGRKWFCFWRNLEQQPTLGSFATTPTHQSRSICKHHKRWNTFETTCLTWRKNAIAFHHIA